MLPSLQSGRAHEKSNATPDPREIYRQLLAQPEDLSVRDAARIFLQACLEQADSQATGFPAEACDWDEWARLSARRCADGYQQYREGRAAGEARRYFQCRAHALHFLRGVSPTKLVDGAWLYGLVRQCEDPRLRLLIHTYLEELGEGAAAHNHVRLYRQLLGHNGCEPLPELPREAYVQGAIQLALGHLAEEFLPEVIGFNLSYEQPPLHVLITAHELDELGIDPWYFRLHVTIDNAASGHAHQALMAMRANQPTSGSDRVWHRRLNRGAALGDLGPGSVEVIKSFDLDGEVLRLLEAKRAFGMNMHADRCQIEGRTVNAWLAEPDGCASFLSALQRTGWIERHRLPEQSRFWQLICGERAAMFGVFDAYERQVLHDWIAGDVKMPAPARQHIPAPLVDSEAERRLDEGWSQRLSTGSAQGRSELLRAMAPHRHWLAQGLSATRVFARYLA